MRRAVDEMETDRAPVAKGDEVHLRIEKTGEKGDGIAFVGGFVVIVPETEPGDAILARVTSVKDSYAFAEVVEHLHG